MAQVAFMALIVVELRQTVIVREQLANTQVAFLALIVLAQLQQTVIVRERLANTQVAFLAIVRLALHPTATS
jgi:hypothetical protein